MYFYLEEQIGKILKITAIVLAVLSLFAGFIALCVLVGDEADGYAYLILIGFVLACIISCGIMFGLGQLVDNTRTGYTPKDYGLYGSKRNDEEQPSKVASTANAGSWTCTCGKVHPKYVSSCDCGISKMEAVQSK